MRYFSLWKIVLGPIFLAQGKRLRHKAIRLPEASGERAGLISSEGTEPELKLLFIGDSTMAGVGVTHQAAALAWQTAALVAECLQRSVRWQMIAKSGVTTGQALAFAQTHTLLKADVLVTALGRNDVLAQTRPGGFIQNYRALLQGALPETGSRIAIVSGLPPMHMTPAVPQPLRWFLGSYAQALDGILQLWIASQQHISFLSLQWAADASKLAEDRFHPGGELYRTWAALIATQIVQRLCSA